MKRKLLLGLLILPLFLAFSASNAFSAIIYDNGAPNWGNGTEMTRWAEADDFVLDVDTYLTDVHFWTMEGYGASWGGNEWDGTLEYYLFADDGGQPDSVAFASGDGQSVVKTGMGLVWDDRMNGFEYSFFLETPEFLSAGTTYWLALHLASDYADIDQIYWVTTDSGSGAFRNFSEGTFDDWSTGSQLQLAFSLTDDAMAVPEPATILLLGSGLIGLGFFRRKEEV